MPWGGFQVGLGRLEKTRFSSFTPEASLDSNAVHVPTPPLPPGAGAGGGVGGEDAETRWPPSPAQAPGPHSQSPALSGGAGRLQGKETAPLRAHLGRTPLFCRKRPWLLALLEVLACVDEDKQPKPPALSRPSHCTHHTRPLPSLRGAGVKVAGRKRGKALSLLASLQETGLLQG